MKKHLILLLTVVAVLSVTLSCGQGQQSAEKQSEADSLLVAVWNAGDYERVIVIADSLGDDRLLELMADAQSLNSHQLIGMMKEAVEQHRNGAEPSDALTLMCLKLQ